jgi:hypothetical protein
MIMANELEPALTATDSDASAELEGIGAAMMLLGAGIVGVALALLLREFHMVWMPLISPLIIGWAIGSSLAFIQRKFQVRAALPAMVTAALGAAIAYGGYHVLVYDRILGFIAENLPSAMEAALADPRMQVAAWLEERTGQTGVLAYLSFVSEGTGSGISPLGLLGRAEPGLALTCLALAVDGLVAVGSALLFVRLRGLSPVAPARPDRRVREVIAHTDATVLSGVMRSIDRGDMDAAARSLGQAVDEPDYAVALVYDPFAQADWELQILTLGPDGPEDLRTSRRLDSWHGQSLRDELELARQGDA